MRHLRRHAIKHAGAARFGRVIKILTSLGSACCSGVGRFGKAHALVAVRAGADASDTFGWCASNMLIGSLRDVVRFLVGECLNQRIVENREFTNFVFVQNRANLNELRPVISLLCDTVQKWPAQQ